jgi:Tn3 transposase DDE domain
MICLQILQSCLGYINTLMIQDTLAEPEWADKLGDADRRGLTPLFTVNMTPYGEIQLNLDRRLDLAADSRAVQGSGANVPAVHHCGRVLAIHQLLKGGVSKTPGLQPYVGL